MKFDSDNSFVRVSDILFSKKSGAAVPACREGLFISVSCTKRIPEHLHNPFGVVACVAIVTQGSASRRNPGLKTQPRWGKQQGTMTDADLVSSRGNLPPTNQDIDKSSLPQRGYVSSPGLRRSATLGIDPNMGSQPQRGCVIVRDSPCIQRAQGFVRLR